MQYLDVILPVPLRRTFEYSLPAEWANRAQTGMRVVVPFGRGKRTLVGIIQAVKSDCEYDAKKIKPIVSLLDREPLIGEHEFRLMRWMSRYYHAPIGEVMPLFLPPKLRKGAPLHEMEAMIALTEKSLPWLAAEGSSRETVKHTIVTTISEKGMPIKAEEGGDGITYPSIEKALLRELFPTLPSHLRELIKRGLLTEFERPLATEWDATHFPSEASSFELSEAQQTAVNSVELEKGVYLLEGVTGSGKTAVYTEIARRVLKTGKQVLLLLPEIGLTPQFITRIEKELNVRMAVIHSRLTDNERFEAWNAARTGKIDLLIGTRSALFTPFVRLGAILIDESHDPSYIQQDGVRYSAVNSGIQRAMRLNIPIVLGTATPTLENYLNIDSGLWKHLKLPHRVKGQLPDWQIVDNNVEAVYDGLSGTLLNEIEATLARKEQVLIFLNRRGFSPVIMCRSCGWMAKCDDCDAYLNFHRATNRLHCHHCGHQEGYPEVCPECGVNDFQWVGVGTQKLEKVLSDAFPAANVMRFDSDSMAEKGEFEASVAKIIAGEIDIIIGTQMLAKGHDFENITLVALVNPDGLFFSNDFRAEEKLAQTLMQVSGRAGRSQKPAKVVIQTLFPSHAVFTELPKVGYQRFTRSLLEMRKLLELPPYSHHALIQVEARAEQQAFHYLEGILAATPKEMFDGVRTMPVMPNRLSRRQGYYRVHTILQAKERSDLHRAIYYLMALYECNPVTDLRFLIEIDPVDYG